MTDKDTMLLTGIPRSGTTLCCHLMNKLPNTIALHEPLPMETFNDLTEGEAINTITSFASTSRDQARAARVMQTKHSAGLVPSNPVFQASNGLRAEQVSLGNINIDKALSETFTLVIKHNALFASLLGNLVKIFPCYGIIRNPLATLASWQTVDLPINQGRLPMGELFDTELHLELNELGTDIDRQLCILRWFYEQFSENLECGHVIRYEDILNTKGNVLSSLVDQDLNFSRQLENQNVSKLYRDLDINYLLDRLVKEDTIFADFYKVEDLENLAKELLAL